MKKTIQTLLIIHGVILLFSFNVISESTWSESTIISSESTSDAYRQCIQVDSENGIHVTWKDNSNILQAGSDFDIFYTYKPYRGSWTSTDLVTNVSVNSSTCLSLAIDHENTLHLVWKDNSDILQAGPDWDIFYAYKPFDKNWSYPQLLSIESNAVCSCPQITSDKKGDIHVVWADADLRYDNQSDTDIVYTKKQGNGQWLPIEIVSKQSQVDSHDPALAIDDSGSIHVTWYENNVSSSTWDIIYTYKEQNGVWNNKELISENCTRSSVDPQISIDSDQHVHLLWNDNSNIQDNGYDYDIFHRTKINEEWTDIKIISQESNRDCSWPYMIIDETNSIHVAWADQTPYQQQDNDTDIMYTSKKPGKDWKRIEEVSVDSIYESNWPRFQIDNNHTVHMTWWDRTNPTWTIYYSQGVIIEDEEGVQTPNNPLSFLLLLIFVVYLIKKYKK